MRTTLSRRLTATPLRWLALLALSAAYLQSALEKALDFGGASAEYAQLGLLPATPLVLATIVLELGAVLAVLGNRGRCLGALLLAGFTLAATFVALRYWTLPLPQRAIVAHNFYENLGLCGGWLLVAWQDLRERADRALLQTHR